jgi:hypothetical protein
MRLQFIHKTNVALEASSLYCRWITVRQGEHEALVAIWMDREMRAFECESLPPAGIEGQVAGAAEIAGDRPLHVWSDEAGEIHDEEARQA